MAQRTGVRQVGLSSGALDSMMELFLNALASGLAQGGIYALIGVGLALIFGAMHVVNLAHGEVLVAGALLTYLLAGAGLPLWGAILLGGGLGGLLGLGLYGLLLPVRREPPISSMVLTYGVALVILYGLVEAFGTDLRNLTYPAWVRPVHLGPIRLALGEIITLGMALLAVGGVAWFLKQSWPGLAVRALTQNREAAIALGISPLAAEALAFALGSALAGLAGALLVVVQPIAPMAAPLFTVKAFVVVVLAGLTSPLGVALAGLLLGAVEGLSALVNPAWGELVAFLTFVLMLLFRPQGLFGRRR